MYYLIHDISEGDYCYIFSKNDSRVTSSSDWMYSIADALLCPHSRGGSWNSIPQLKSDSNIKFLVSSTNPITPNSHPELFI